MVEVTRAVTIRRRYGSGERIVLPYPSEFNACAFRPERCTMELGAKQ